MLKKGLRMSLVFSGALTIIRAIHNYYTSSRSPPSQVCSEVQENPDDLRVAEEERLRQRHVAVRVPGTGFGKKSFFARISLAFFDL